MPDYPEAAVTAAAEAIERELMSGTEYVTNVDSDEALARAALNAAAPILASREQEAVRLLEEALHIRMYGERAPGGTENWHDWDRQAEDFLRSLSAAMREDGNGQELGS